MFRSRSAVGVEPFDRFTITTPGNELWPGMEIRAYLGGESGYEEALRYAEAVVDGLLRAGFEAELALGRGEPDPDDT